MRITFSDGDHFSHGDEVRQSPAQVKQASPCCRPGSSCPPCAAGCSPRSVRHRPQHWTPPTRPGASRRSCTSFAAERRTPQVREGAWVAGHTPHICQTRPQRWTPPAHSDASHRSCRRFAAGGRKLVHPCTPLSAADCVRHRSPAGVAGGLRQVAEASCLGKPCPCAADTCCAAASHLLCRPLWRNALG